MGGTNPYIPTPATEKPKQTFSITFIGNDGKDRKIVEVFPDKIPYGETGLPGSLLDIALGAGIEMDHACGGVCACSTCHVYVKEGLASCSVATDAENDMVDLAPDIRSNSRLGCQCVPNGTVNLTVEIPSWNRNLVREGH